MKKFLAVMLTLVMVFSLAACGGPEAPADGDGEGAAEPRTLVLSHHCIEDDSNHVFAQAFADKVEELSGGQLKIDIYTSGQLYGQADAVEALRQGTLDMCLCDTAMFVNYDGGTGVLDLPYVFNTREEAINVTRNPEFLAAFRDRAVQKSGIDVLGIIVLNFRNSIVTDMNVKDIDGFKGMIMRTPESPTIIAAFEAFGASPTVIPSGEAYTALQTGVADAAECHSEYIYNQKYWEVAKNYVRTEHVMCYTTLSMADKTYQTLTDEQKAWFDEAVQYGYDVFYDYTDGLFEAKEQAMVEEGGITITEVDKQPFKDAVADYVNNYTVENDCVELYDLMNSLK